MDLPFFEIPLWKNFMEEELLFWAPELMLYSRVLSVFSGRQNAINDMDADQASAVALKASRCSPFAGW